MLYDSEPRRLFIDGKYMPNPEPIVVVDEARPDPTAKLTSLPWGMTAAHCVPLFDELPTCQEPSVWTVPSHEIGDWTKFDLMAIEGEPIFSEKQKDGF